MLAGLWAALWAAVSATLSRIGGIMQPIVTGAAVDLVKAAANTPEYKPSTRAESVASEQVKVDVVDNIKNSELWNALHKN